MMTAVYITIDTELSSRHFARYGLNGLADNFQRAIEGRTADGRNSVGISYQMTRMEAHGVRGVFFVDPMPAIVAGDDIVRRIVDPILSRGHDVQLHVHTEWLDHAEGGPTDGRTGKNMASFHQDDQERIFQYALDVLNRVGVPTPVAFRAGNYGADDSTLRALASVGLTYDSSFCPGIADGPCAISLPTDCTAATEHCGVIEVPIAAINGWGGRLRHAQVTALSSAEVNAALVHAASTNVETFTIVSHSFELMCRERKRANPIVLRRLDAMCATIADHPGLESGTYVSHPPRLANAKIQSAERLPHSLPRTLARTGEQILSNQLYGEVGTRRARAAVLTEVGPVRAFQDRIMSPIHNMVPVQNLALDLLSLI